MPTQPQYYYIPRIRLSVYHRPKSVYHHKHATVFGVDTAELCKNGRTDWDDNVWGQTRVCPTPSDRGHFDTKVVVLRRCGLLPSSFDTCTTLHDGVRTYRSTSCVVVWRPKTLSREWQRLRSANSENRSATRRTGELLGLPISVYMAVSRCPGLGSGRKNPAYAPNSYTY